MRDAAGSTAVALTDFSAANWHQLLAGLGLTGIVQNIASHCELTARDVRLMLLFSEVDWGWDYLHAIMGEQIREWSQQGNPRLETVKRADHMMTPLVSQDRTQHLVLDWASRLPTREEFVL